MLQAILLSETPESWQVWIQDSVKSNTISDIHVFLIITCSNGKFWLLHGLVAASNIDVHVVINFSSIKSVECSSQIVEHHRSKPLSLIALLLTSLWIQIWREGTSLFLNTNYAPCFILDLVITQALKFLLMPVNQKPMMLILMEEPHWCWVAWMAISKLHSLC